MFLVPPPRCMGLQPVQIGQGVFIFFDGPERETGALGFVARAQPGLNLGPFGVQTRTLSLCYAVIG